MQAILDEQLSHNWVDSSVFGTRTLSFYSAFNAFQNKIYIFHAIRKWNDDLLFFDEYLLEKKTDK